MAKQRTPNDERSIVKNPNNPAHEADRVNRERQEETREPNEPKKEPRTASPIISVDLVQAALRSEEMRAIPVEDLRRDAEDYERFLLLVQRHWDEDIAPTKAIDRMWHLHMLHPRAYYEDCIRLFGEILDHDGGFGSTADEAPVLAETFALTADLWQHAYDAPYVGGGVACKRNCVSRCQRRCKTISGFRAALD
jgi:hypothetical protein